MDLHLRGKSVLITGASKGIGAATAEAFAEEGSNVHLAAPGIVDEDIDAGGFVRQTMKIVRFAQIDRMRNDVDLMNGAQPFGQRPHRLGAAHSRRPAREDR
jgi:NAD(P)-dependent dehydrogenase (short-subunit alcohol dehydrogenase family)